MSDERQEALFGMSEHGTPSVGGREAAAVPMAPSNATKAERQGEAMTRPREGTLLAATLAYLATGPKTAAELTAEVGHRFSARIFTLREMGHDIRTVNDTTGETTGFTYELVGRARTAPPRRANWYVLAGGDNGALSVARAWALDRGEYTVLDPAHGHTYLGVVLLPGDVVYARQGGPDAYTRPPAPITERVEAYIWLGERGLV